MPAGNNIMSANDIVNNGENPFLKHLFSSKEWKNYFQSFSAATGFNIEIYGEDGTLLTSINENPICRLVKSSAGNGAKCPASCTQFILESLNLNEPATYKCFSKIMNFSVPIKYLNEKAVIVGKNNFASYEDFLEFLKIAKDHDIHEIPVTTSLNFTNETYIKNISNYIHKTTNYLLGYIHDKHRLTEKISRFTSLVDINILKKLSENTGSICRYIVDTIEFILSPISVAMLIPDRQTSLYKTEYATGEYKNILMRLEVNPENTLIKQVLATKMPVSPVVIEADKFTGDSRDKLKSLYLFPIYFEDSVNGLIGVLNGQLPHGDLKIINAFRDYIELSLKNYSLSRSINKKMDETLSSIFDSAKSIAPPLDRERLLQTIVEKATHLLKAEQGSLMLLNEETDELLVEAKKSIDNVIKESMRLGRGEGIAGKVFESGEPLLVEDVEKDSRINQKNRARYKTKSFISIPLKIEERTVGVLNISDKISGNIFNESDLRLIQFFSTSASIAIERSLLYKKIEELKELSVTDPLTGIMNRRYLNDRLSEEIARYNRYKQPFSLLMVDVDEFKEFNDTHGHIIGDKVLKDLAAIIVESLRNTDIPARFGGDEFVLILPQTPKADAINIANRIKENVEKTCTPHREEFPYKGLTVSIGLTSYPDDASSAAELFEKTDQALYLAKKGGRNRLVYL